MEEAGKKGGVKKRSENWGAGTTSTRAQLLQALTCLTEAMSLQPGKGATADAYALDIRCKRCCAFLGLGPAYATEALQEAELFVQLAPDEAIG